MQEEEDRKMPYSFFQSRKGGGYLSRLEEDGNENVRVKCWQYFHDFGDEMIGLL